MGIEGFERVVARLVERGGPAEHEYRELDAEAARLHEHVRAGKIAQAQVRAVLDRHGEPFGTKTLQGHALRKPRGYAGDYRIIDMIYQRQVAPEPHLARWDEFFHAQAAPQAVRNRKAYFHRLLDAQQARGAAFSVLKLGAGPGRSMHEWLRANPHAQARFECVDVDAESVAYASRLNAAFAERIRFHAANVFKYRSEAGARHALVWAAGLFDYFDDATFVRVARRFLPCVAPGGELVIGNFAIGNPTRAYMELFGEWYLQHRSEADLLRLARAIGGGDVRARVDREDAGVNLFLHIAR